MDAGDGRRLRCAVLRPRTLTVTVLLALATALAGGPAIAPRLSLALVTAAGTRAGWPEPAVAALHALRSHADLRTRHAAHPTRREALVADDDDE